MKRYQRGVVHETPIDWLYLSKVHYRLAQKEKHFYMAHKRMVWSWMALLLWAEAA